IAESSTWLGFNRLNSVINVSASGLAGGSSGVLMTVGVCTWGSWGDWITLGCWGCCGCCCWLVKSFHVGTLPHPVELASSTTQRQHQTSLPCEQQSRFIVAPFLKTATGGKSNPRMEKESAAWTYVILRIALRKCKLPSDEIFVREPTGRESSSQFSGTVSWNA